MVSASQGYIYIYIYMYMACSETREHDSVYTCDGFYVCIYIYIYIYKACLNIHEHMTKYTNVIVFPLWGWRDHKSFLAATKQLYKWYFPSLCPSVRLSVRLSVTPFWLCSHHRIIMKFSGVITNDQRKVHAKGQGQRSKVKVTEVTTQLNSFRTVTPVWIHIWWWNDAYSLMLLRRGALLFFKVIRQISRSHGSKNRRIWPRLGVSGL